MAARFQQIYCVQQTYRGFIAALSGEYGTALAEVEVPPEALSGIGMGEVSLLRQPQGPDYCGTRASVNRFIIC